LESARHGTRSRGSQCSRAWGGSKLAKVSVQTLSKRR
jgi:hypothetical protein